MPLYEYECEACGQRFELIRKFSDPEVDTCARCGKGPVRRLLSSPAIQFKGTGWYITDYSQKGKSSEGKSEGKSGTDASTPAGGTDSKSASSGDATSKKETPAPSAKPAASDT
jgi:putative FmdB family regulatory protein